MSIGPWWTGSALSTTRMTEPISVMGDMLASEVSLGRGDTSGSTGAGEGAAFDVTSDVA